MRIGYFVKGEGGYAGHLHTLSLNIDLALVEVEKHESETAPDYRVIAGSDDEAREIGAGWNHVGEKAGDYVAIQIDDPLFLAPLRANIFKDEDGHYHLVWSRQSKRDGEV
ncbi:MAG: DUF736 domain-containing protein [Novosphingobium sp.]